MAGFAGEDAGFIVYVFGVNYRAGVVMVVDESSGMINEISMRQGSRLVVVW